MPAGVGSRSFTSVAGRMRLGGAGRSDAGSGRQLRFSTRGLWRSAFWAADVVSFYLADAISGATQYFLGRIGIRGLLEICGRQSSGLERLARRASIGKQLQPGGGAHADRHRGVFAVPADHPDWKDLHSAVAD